MSLVDDETKGIFYRFFAHLTEQKTCLTLSNWPRNLSRYIAWGVMFSQRHFRKFKKKILVTYASDFTKNLKSWPLFSIITINLKSCFKFWNYQRFIKRLVFFVLQSWGWKVAIRYTIRIYFNFVLCMIGKDQWHSPNGHGSR